MAVVLLITRTRASGPSTVFRRRQRSRTRNEPHRLDFRKTLEARFPADTGIHAHPGCDEARVSESDAGSAIERFQDVGHRRRRAWHPNGMPSMHELSWWIDLEEFALNDVRAFGVDARRSPTATHTHLARPLPSIEDVGSDPPFADLFRDKRRENPLRRSRDIDTRMDQPFSKVGDCTRSRLRGDFERTPP